jgi:DNA-binding HxlR family transcriptional regulator
MSDIDNEQTPSEYQERVFEHLGMAFRLLTAIDMAQKIDGAPSCQEALAQISPEFINTLGLLINAGFASQITIDKSEQAFEYRITWKGKQFIAAYATFIHTEEGETQDALLRILLGFH